MGNQTDEKFLAKAKTSKASEISKWSMVVASIWIAGLSLLKAFWHLPSSTEFGLTMNKILPSGVAPAAVFTPVYLSIRIDKFTGAFKGGGGEK
jgi:hypothetical protein